MTTPAFRPVAHPGQADTLVHFCGRARQDFSPEVAFLSAGERLASIVREQAIRAHPPHGSSSNVVCLSESDPTGVQALLARMHFEGWGVVLRRDWVWARGGAPVWYVRGDLWQRLRADIDLSFHHWMVRTEPHHADWLHEREWRVPCPDGPLTLDNDGVVALLVSDDGWEPWPEFEDIEHVGEAGDRIFIEATPELATQVPRWLWTGSEVLVLPPLERRVYKNFVAGDPSEL